MQLALKQVVVPPGQQLLLKDVSWQMYENILEELGEKHGSRINYFQGMLEIMIPLPEHEIDKEIIGDLVKILLEELDIEFAALGSTTYKNKQMAGGIEADRCFYIQNESAIRGKDRIDLNIYPPPDLALEIDITETLRTKQRNNQSQQKECDAKMRSITEQDIQAFATRWSTKIKKYLITLETIAQDEANLREYLQEQLRQQERQQEESRSSLNMRMLNFKNAFPEITSELATTLEYLDEYLKLKIQIEKDDLPRHEKRFKQLMNEKVIIAISMFKSSLEKQEEEIQQSVDELNESLQNIDYTESTYIKLC